MGGGSRRASVRRGGACPACSRLRRARLCDREMAEGELDVDSLISRLLEGEFDAARLFTTRRLATFDRKLYLDLLLRPVDMKTSHFGC